MIKLKFNVKQNLQFLLIYKHINNYQLEKHKIMENPLINLYEYHLLLIKNMC